MEKIVVTDSQKRLALYAFFGVVAIAGAILILYVPQLKRVAQLRQEAARIEGEVRGLKEKLGNTISLEELTTNLTKKTDDLTAALNRKFPEKEEVILRELAALAAGSGLEITSLRPDKKRTITTAATGQKDQAAIKGCVIQEMPIALTAKGRYKVLGEFLRALADEFPIFVRVDHVRMSKGGGGKGDTVIDIGLRLDTFLICEQSPGAAGGGAQ